MKRSRRNSRRWRRRGMAGVKASGGGPIRGEYGWGRIPPPSPSATLPPVTLLLIPLSPRGWNHRHFQPAPPLSTFFLLLHLHLYLHLHPLRKLWSLLFSEAPAAPGGYPRQVPARDSHGMTGDRYVRPTARISTAEDFHDDFRASTRYQPIIHDTHATMLSAATVVVDPPTIASTWMRPIVRRD